MRDAGNYYDNAMMESFFASLKTECAVDRFLSRPPARQAIFAYIELWYNCHRRHSALDYRNLAAFEQHVV